MNEEPTSGCMFCGLKLDGLSYPQAYEKLMFHWELEYFRGLFKKHNMNLTRMSYEAGLNVDTVRKKVIALGLMEPRPRNSKGMTGHKKEPEKRGRKPKPKHDYFGLIPGKK